jgi:anti-sigma-K factor RskA
MATHEQFAEDLALYMLGELDPARATDFKAHIESCAECQRELQQMRADVAAYAISTIGPAAPARARERFIQAMKSEKPGSVSPAPTTSSWWPRFATAAFAVLALFFLANSVITKRALRSYERQNQQLQADLQRQQALWAALNSPDAVHMTLTAARAPEPQGRVIYVPKRGTVVFFANYFAPAPKDKVYQLWLLPASGNAPMPCGTFKPDQLGMASFTMEGMPEDVQAKNFAVTLEPSGGSQKPTMPLLMTASARFPTE